MRGRIQHMGCIVLAMTMVGMLGACGDDNDVTIHTIVDVNEATQEAVEESNEEKTSSWKGQAMTLEGEDIPVSTVVETQEVAEPQVTTITISATGDVTLGTHQEQDYYASFRQVYDQVEDEGYFFQNVQDIFGTDDCTIVNLEGNFTYSENYNGDRTYYIKGDPEYARLLTYGSIEVATMANNHRLDFGEEGSRDTVNALEAEGIAYAYDSKVVVYETKGIRIGVVAVNEIGWGAGVESLLQDGIAKLREQDVDLILTCCHWGIERENYPEDYQKKLGRKCIDWGADLVIGHHPHVIQGIEEYQGKFIIYSLGNFCFGANRNPVDKDCMIFQQTFTFVDGVKQEDKDIQVIPCSVSSVSDRNNFQPTPAQGDEAIRILNRINEYSKEFGVELDNEGRLVE